MNSGCGKIDGIIRARSCFILLKCAVPVKMNITASAYAAESCQWTNLETPSAPIARNISHEPKSTINTAISLQFSEPQAVQRPRGTIFSHFYKNRGNLGHRQNSIEARSGHAIGIEGPGFS